jgi:S-adenosylmethionine synthetase
MNTKKITYDDTRDASIRVIEKLINIGLIDHIVDNDDHYFEVQDTIQDEFNELLQLDMDDNFEVKIKLKNK